ncbi:MAG: DNA ligase [Pseudoxanthomonas sp.]
MCLRVLLCLCVWLSGAALTPLRAAPPQLMLATDFRSNVQVADYWVSEKLDGVRGRWDGQRLLTRSGQPIAAPAWFIARWPKVPMDGELWIGRGRFDEVSGLVRAGMSNEAAWRRVRFMVFDLPEHEGTFTARVLRMQTLVVSTRIPWLQAAPQFRLGSVVELEAKLAQVVANGGEGLMLHRATALYQAGRSGDLIKYKQYQDAEARVVAYAPGKGKYTGMLGALLVRMPDGRQFRLGSGFTDRQRADPPPLGSLVTYRYNGLTRTGLPRFARFQRIRTDPPPPDPR